VHLFIKSVVHCGGSQGHCFPLISVASIRKHGNGTYGTDIVSSCHRQMLTFALQLALL
jgi:hypothetical protein